MQRDSCCLRCIVLRVMPLQDVHLPGLMRDLMDEPETVYVQAAGDLVSTHSEASGALHMKPRPVLLREYWRNAGFVSDAQLLHGTDQVKFARATCSWHDSSSAVLPQIAVVPCCYVMGCALQV
jgi:hypothetical protein